MGEGVKSFFELLKKHSVCVLCILALLIFMGGLIGCSYRQDLKKIRALQHLEMNISDVHSVLVLGNSISIHGKCSYWWGKWGMAASNQDKDFVHQLQRKLNCKVDVWNFYQWEVMAHDRAETYSLLDRFLGNKYNLIVVQLGENISNTDTLAKDFFEFIQYLKTKQPQAGIVIVGNYWTNYKVDSVKQGICDGKKVAYVDLSDMDNEKYYCGMGTMVSGEDGIMHKIDHKGVAKHPGDKAMTEIADRIVRVLK